MFAQFLLLVLQAKAHLISAATIPVIAALLVLGSTGFIVTGTTSGDDDDRTVNLTVKPLESKKCIDALIAQTETLLQLDFLAGDAVAQLRDMRERARENADDQHKLLDETALLTQSNTSSVQVQDALAAARQDVLKAADLGKCEDRNPGTTVDLDIADLRAKYDQIVKDFGLKLTGILVDAQKAFDLLVANAPLKPDPVQSGSGSSSRD